jgi:hypothetical protein
MITTTLFEPQADEKYNDLYYTFHLPHLTTLRRLIIGFHGKKGQHGWKSWTNILLTSIDL